MGRPVVHFEVIGTDGEKLREYYAQLFDWKFDIAEPMKYGVVDREDNPAPDGSLGIGGGVAGYDEVADSVTFYVAVPDVEAALVQAEELGGSRVMGPEKVSDAVELGQFRDPEGHLIGLVHDGS